MLMITLLQLVGAPGADPAAIVSADTLQRVFACDGATITGTPVKQLVDMCLGYLPGFCMLVAYIAPFCAVWLCIA
jgi:hypothetical protein